jgi:hypothetical protein
MQGTDENVLTVTDKINSLQENLALWGVTIKKEKAFEMYELSKYCRMDKNRVA